jgi:hypothetical protein
MLTNDQTDDLALPAVEPDLSAATDASMLEDEADFLDEGNPEVALVAVILSCVVIAVLFLLRRFI